MDPITIGTAIGTSLLTQFATKGDSAPIKTLDNLWYLAFGNFNLHIDKMRAKNNINLEKYKDDIAKEVLAIPDDNLIEPPLSIVGPALEASKYYIDEEKLRLMFAKIVASSMDDRKSSYSHPSFVEIIKQLSALDANNLLLFKHGNRLPILNLLVKKESGSMIPLLIHGFLNTPEYSDISRMESSLSNLLRLGLVVINYNLSMKDNNVYDALEKGKHLQNHMKYLKLNYNYELSSQKGIIELTPLGQNFKLVCL